MTQLTIYRDDGETTVWRGDDPVAIAEKLAAIGVRFEQWDADAPLPADADDAAVMDAYAPQIERLKREGGYQAVDVIRVPPDHPARTELRTKFLDEHTHGEDEVRFFVGGRGMFYLRAAGQVHRLLCERGDLLGVPAGMRHWFDLGAAPDLTAIRLFINPEGWVAHYTGDAIAARYPKLDEAA